MTRKTKRMLEVEKQQGRSIERLLPDMAKKLGLSRTAEELGVSRATLGYWLLKLEINVSRAAWAPQDRPVEALRDSAEAGSPSSQRPRIRGSDDPIFSAAQSFCASCGEDLPWDARFCPHCGHRIESEPDLQTQVVEPNNVEMLKALIRAQELVRQYVPEGRSLADELIQQRRAEAAAE